MFLKIYISTCFITDFLLHANNLFYTLGALKLMNVYLFYLGFI
jgi:hypothetical protein